MESTISSGGGTEASAPLSFEQAFAADVSPASDSSPQTTTPADAAVPPDAREATPADDRSPFIPRDRFDSVNKRMQEAEAFKQQYAWAAQHSADDIQQLVQFREALKADPLTTMTQEFAVLAQHPTYGPQFRSWVARQLATRPQAPQPAPEPAPPPYPTIQLEDGRQIDLQALSEQIERKALEKAQQQFKPAMDAAQELQQAKAMAHAQQQAHSFASSFLPELRQLPQFKEHEAEIKQALAQTRLETDHPAEVKAATLAIYNRLVLPKLTQNAQSQLLDNLQQKAAAATSVNPGSAAPSTPRKPASFFDPSLQWK